jgi:hypothetical protein
VRGAGGATKPCCHDLTACRAGQVRSAAPALPWVALSIPTPWYCCSDCIEHTFDVKDLCQELPRSSENQNTDPPPGLGS